MRAIFALALLFCCLAEVLMEGLEAKAALAIQSCMAENNITMQDVDEGKSGNLNPDDVKDNMKCATLCLLVKLDVMDARGTLQQDELLALVSDDTVKEKMKEALGACGNISGSNPCDKAYRFMDCFGKHFNDLLSM